MNPFTRRLTEFSDVILAILVILVIGMMIIPLPTILIDILLTMNISIGVTILLVALYVSGAINLSVFPSILLITTLFRLALNVSTTRLILLNANAGNVIKAFGQFVVQGNMVVGAVVFLILTLVNFIVISKGSERVAEVAARFSLDAMPGKQMAIDADLRSGSLDMEEAKIKRRDLERESQLFGSMDGAMKFVKGDAIAGILITMINIIGGIIIGTLMRQMNIMDALKTYGLLTIGDGLVSQIPALIISTSAGLIVTRVAPEDEGRHLGRDIGLQILAYPKAIAITSGLLFLLGLTPGLPIVPFWFLAAFTGIIAVSIYFSEKSQNHSMDDGEKQEPEYTEENSLMTLPIPIMITVGQDLSRMIEDYETQMGCSYIEKKITDIRWHVYEKTGVRLPGIKIQGYHPKLESFQYQIFIGEICVDSYIISKEHIIVGESLKNLRNFKMDGQTIMEPGGYREIARVKKTNKERLLQTGIRVWEDLDILSLHIENILLNYAHDFLGMQEVKWLCEEMEKFFPDLVQEIVPRIIGYPKLTDILKRLVQESINIRNFKEILELIAEYAQVIDDNCEIVERVRGRLKRQITNDYLDNSQAISVFMVDTEIEDIFKSSIQQTFNEKYLAMDPEIMEQILDEFHRELKTNGTSTQPIILTMDSEIRHILWRFLNHSFPGIKVISVNEILPETPLLPIGKISFSTR